METPELEVYGVGGVPGWRPAGAASGRPQPVCPWSPLTGRRRATARDGRGVWPLWFILQKYIVYDWRTSTRGYGERGGGGPGWGGPGLGGLADLESPRRGGVPRPRGGCRLAVYGPLRPGRRLLSPSPATSHGAIGTSSGSGGLASGFGGPCVADGWGEGVAGRAGVQTWLSCTEKSWGG